MNKQLAVDDLLIRKGALIMRAIRHTLRQKMLKLIHENGRLSVTEIYVKLRIEQSVASQHLAILRKAGFVVTEREGKQIFYSINHNRIHEVNNVISALLKNNLYQ
jgi:DNA-binding transcriptional ArsR family regulator